MAAALGIYVQGQADYEQIGRVRLGEDGAAVIEPAHARQMLERIRVVDLDTVGRPELTAAQGELYMRMLPRLVAGGALRVVEL